MIKINKKVLMFDAGTAIFESKAQYGPTLGQLKAELQEYGKVMPYDDSITQQLPPSTEHFDFFLDCSTLWSIRYISCQLEDSGNTGKTTNIGEEIRRYSVSFKEGNKSSVVRGLAYILFITTLIIATLYFQHFYITIPCVVLILALIYNWLTPSKTSPKIVQEIIQKIENNNT